MKSLLPERLGHGRQTLESPTSRDRGYMRKYEREKPLQTARIALLENAASIGSRSGERWSMSEAHRRFQGWSSRHLRWRFRPPLLLVAILYVLPLAGSAFATNPNEVARIELSASIAFWARFDLGSAAEVYGLSEDVSTRDGKIYSDKAPGLSMIAVLLLVYSLQGSAPTAETELIRSQVLRRLGHTAMADRLEDSLLSAATPARD